MDPSESSTPAPSADTGRAAAFGTFAPLLDASIAGVFSSARALVRGRPSLVIPLVRMARRSQAAAATRARLREEGLVVPPVLIVSVTHRCNLRCRGCYAHEHTWERAPEMSASQLLAILKEAESLGVSFVILAGGEPLARTDLLSLTRQVPGIVFPLFTNGLLLTGPVIEELKGQRHVVPLVSIEGTREDTDARRGEGMHERILSVLGELDRAGILFGVSLTVSRKNLLSILDPQVVEDLYLRGARIFYFVEYVAMHEGTDELEITPDERARLLAHIGAMRTAHPGIYVAFPGDEERFGGCLSSGRGFVHINPVGGLEPCPAAPFTDINVTSSSLRAALSSPMLAAIRDNHAVLDESQGGCALWRNRKKVAAILDAVTDYECTGRL